MRGSNEALFRINLLLSFTLGRGFFSGLSGLRRHAKILHALQLQKFTFSGPCNNSLHALEIRVL